MASYQAICLESTLHILGFFGCQIWNDDLQLALHGSPLRPQLTMPRNSQLFNNNYYMSLGGVAWTDAVSSFKVSLKLCFNPSCKQGEFTSYPQSLRLTLDDIGFILPAR